MGNLFLDIIPFIIYNTYEKNVFFRRWTVRWDFPVLEGLGLSFKYSINNFITHKIMSSWFFFVFQSDDTKVFSNCGLYIRMFFLIHIINQRICKMLKIIL